MPAFVGLWPRSVSSDSPGREHGWVRTVCGRYGGTENLFLPCRPYLLTDTIM
jgi:hypothetical protein